MKITVFWDLTSCNMVEHYQCFGGTRHLSIFSVKEYAECWYSEKGSRLGSLVNQQNTDNSVVLFCLFLLVCLGPWPCSYSYCCTLKSSSWCIFWIWFEEYYEFIYFEEAVFSSKTSVMIYQMTHHNLGGSNLHSHCHDNPKFRTDL
jgi:hypothetical protein